MPSLQDMRERVKEAGLMKLDKLIEKSRKIKKTGWKNQGRCISLTASAIFTGNECYLILNPA